MPDLTPPQELFCRELVNAKFNATAAYRVAYTKCKSDEAAAAAASRLLGNVKVQNRVAEIVNEAAAAEGITPQRVVRELGFIAFQRASQVHRPDGSLRPPSEWDEAADTTIAGVEMEEEEFEPADDAPQPRDGSPKRSRATLKLVRTSKVKRWDKIRALELLMKHLGLLKEDAPHLERPRFDLSRWTDEQKRAMLALFRAAAPAPEGRT